MNITTAGIDLAKNTFSVHGKVVLKQAVTRGKLLETLANLPPCRVAMEACSGAHHWARRLSALGHDARIIAPRFVIPYRKSGKNDGNDAEAICEAAQRLMSAPGIGAITATATATAVVASIADPGQFHNGRQLAAWLGLVPRQYSTGGKTRLGRITKQGDKYLRMLLIHGARSVLASLGDKQDRVSCWLRELIERRGYKRATVALAAKNARLIWVLLTRGEDYRIQPAAMKAA